MKSSIIVRQAGAVALVTLLAGCASWNSMGRAEAGTAPTRASAPATSPVVREAQQALFDRGYDVGPVDGVYGPSTRDAVIHFQNAQGIAQTGSLDAQTLSALGVPH